MKYCVIFVVTCILGITQAGILTEEQKEKVLKIHAECMKESGVDEAIALKAQQGEYTDDPKLKKQIFCFSKKAGFQNEAGDIQVDYIKTKLMDMVKDEKAVDDLVQKCNVKKENGEESAFAMAKCFHEAAPSKTVLA